jgi:hypothetical protein
MPPQSIGFKSIQPIRSAFTIPGLLNRSQRTYNHGAIRFPAAGLPRVQRPFLPHQVVRQDGKSLGAVVPWDIEGGYEVLTGGTLSAALLALVVALAGGLSWCAVFNVEYPRCSLSTDR